MMRPTQILVMMKNPLILTLKINEHAQQYFNALRKQYFPPERNFLDAHLTLFHQLPAEELALVKDIESVADVTPAFAMQVSKIVSTGNGVAFKIESGELASLHKYLQQKWKQWLIPQDLHTLWPHITIQNKVTADKAKELLDNLSAGFKPFEITTTGFALWEYLGGPWKFVQEFGFKL